MENTRFDQIQQFIRGDLKGSELSDFNTLLASDTDLQQEVELYKLIDDAFIDKGLLDVKKKFANIDRQSLSGNSFKWSVGLVVLIMVTSGYFIYQNETKIKPKIAKQADAIILKQVALNEVKETKSKAVQKSSINITLELPKETSKEENILKIPSLIPDQTTESKITSPEKVNSLETKEIQVEKTTCEEVKITAEVTTQPECDHKHDGKIIINEKSIKGGNSPYTFSIKNGKYGATSTFNYLSAGRYNIYIKDSKNCIEEMKAFSVVSSICFIEQSFAPQLGEECIIQLVPESKGSIIIYNEAGDIVFKRNFSSEPEIRWDGKDINGNDLTLSSYPFILKYEDGKTINGQITIVK